MIFQTLLVLFCSRRSAFSWIFGLVHRRVLLPAPWQCYLRLTEQTRLPLRSFMASSTTRKCLTCSAALCKCGVYDRTLLAGCNTRRYRLESRAGWKGTGPFRLANYAADGKLLGKNGKVWGQCLLPKAMVGASSNKTLNKEERRFFTLLLAQLFLKVRERMRKWRGNGERMRKWREIHSLHFLIFS